MTKLGLCQDLADDITYQLNVFGQLKKGRNEKTTSSGWLN